MIHKKSLKKWKSDLKLGFANKIRNHLILIIIGAIIIVLLGVLLITQLIKPKIASGDTVIVDYTGYFEDGTIFDTSIQETGIKAGLKKEAYESFKFTIGQDQVIPGFEEALIGLSKGENKKFTLPPDKAYGNVNEAGFIKNLPRNLNMTRYSIVNTSSYKNIFDSEPKVGKILNRPDIPWDMQVVDITDDKVKIENLLSIDQSLNLSGRGWQSIVEEVGNEFIIIRQNPKVGDRLVFPTPAGVKLGVVSKVSDTTYDINANNPLAGKTLTFDVEVKKIEKAK